MYVCVCGGGGGGCGGCVRVYMYVSPCTETCEHVCVSSYTSILIYTHVYASVCVCVRARVLGSDYVNARVFVFQCVSVSLCFVWLIMCSNVLLCYWFLRVYLCIPCFSLIKWQSVCVKPVCVLSRRTRTINPISLLISVIHQAEFDISVQFVMPQWGRNKCRTSSES